MKLKEAIKARIPRVRRPMWMPDTYLRLPLMENGTHGPWAELYDPSGQPAIGEAIGSQKILVIGDTGETDDLEPYTGQPHPAEAGNYAARYLEE